MAETKAAFRRRIGNMLGILTATTATSNGAADFTTVVSTNLLDNFPNDEDATGAVIYRVLDATWRRIASWTAGNTATATMSRAFATPLVASAEAIELYTNFTPDVIDNALKLALTECYPYIAAEVVDTSLSIVANQFEYTIPTTIRDLNQTNGATVEFQINTSITTFPYQRLSNWKVRTAAGAHTLVLPIPLPPIGRTLRLCGLGILSYPATDTTSIPLLEDNLQLVAYKTAEILYRQTNAASPDDTFNQTQAAMYNKLFEDFKDRFGTIVPSGVFNNSSDQLTYRYGDLAEFNSDPS